METILKSRFLGAQCEVKSRMIFLL